MVGGVCLHALELLASYKELDRLESAGIIEKVPYADWAAPIVLVPKSDESLRLCGDYKLTVNRSLEVEQYPLPKASDLFSSLTSGQKFTKLIEILPVH